MTWVYVYMGCMVFTLVHVYRIEKRMYDEYMMFKDMADNINEVAGGEAIKLPEYKGILLVGIFKFMVGSPIFVCAYTYAFTKGVIKRLNK